jgi:hypothetical protein
MPLPTGPTVPIKFQKSISQLPGTLTPDSLYAVRVGAGFDLYVSDMTGNIAYKSNSAAGGGSALEVSLINGQNTVTNSVYEVSALRFDTDAGFDLTDLGNGEVKVGMNSTFKYITVDGQDQLVAQGLDTLKLIAGTGINITTDIHASPKSLTINASGTGVIKTFNILNSFSAPLIGNSIFVPSSTDYIKSVQLTNGQAVGTDLTVGLYRNNELLGFYSIPAGQITAKVSTGSFRITTSDYITVNVVAGQGLNFSLALLNIN